MYYSLSIVTDHMKKMDIDRLFSRKSRTCSAAALMALGALVNLFISNFVAKMLLTAFSKSNRKAMNRNWSNQKANPALKTKVGNK